jgi:hypothetical protein
MEPTGETPESKEKQLVPMYTMKFRVRKRVERVFADGKVELISETIQCEYVPNPLIQKAIVDFFRSEEIKMSIFFITFIAIVMVGGNKL